MYNLSFFVLLFWSKIKLSWDSSKHFPLSQCPIHFLQMRQSRWNSWMDHPDQEGGKASDAKLFTFCIWYFIFWKTSANLTGRQGRLAMQKFSNFAKRQKPPKASGIWGAGQRAKGLLEENWAKFLKPPARLHYVLRRRTSKESFKFDNRAILRQPRTLLIWGRINKSTINLQPYCSVPDLYLSLDMKSLYGLGLREWVHYIVGSGLFGAVCWEDGTNWGKFGDRRFAGFAVLGWGGYRPSLE